MFVGFVWYFWYVIKYDIFFLYYLKVFSDIIIEYFGFKYILYLDMFYGLDYYYFFI